MKRRSLAIILLLVTSGSILGCSVDSHPDARQTRAGRLAGPAIPPVEETCPTRLSLDEATRALDAPVLLPNDDLAAGEGEGARLCPSGEIVFVYSSGISISEAKNTLTDPEAEWRQLADDSAEFSVGSTHGVAASFADPEKGALGGVQFVLDSGRYILSGDGKLPLSALVRVADSLQAAA